MKCLLKSTFLILVTLVSISVQAKEKIYVWEHLSQYSSTMTLLAEALGTNEPESSQYEIVASRQIEQGDAVVALSKGDRLDVASFPPDQWKYKNLLSVPFPINRGLLGLRVCLVHKKHLGVFQLVNNLEDLKKFGIQFVQGESWPDTQILRDNGLSVVTSRQYRSLFSLVDSDQPRCFSRSLSEILTEASSFKKFNLVVEPRLLIFYRLPTLFFINPNKEKLFRDLKSGLEKLIKSGRYHQIFWSEFNGLFRKFDVKSRKLIPLKNAIKQKKDSTTPEYPRIWLSDVFIKKMAE